MDLLEEAMKVKAALYITDVFGKIKASTSPEMTRDNEMIAQQKLPMMTAHFDYITVNLFRQRVAQDIEKGAIRSAGNKSVIDTILKVYILDNLIKDNGILMSCGYISSNAFSSIIQALDICIKEIRPNMVSLVEA